MTQQEARERLAQATKEAREARKAAASAAHALNKATYEALAAGVGATEISREYSIARSRIYQRRDAYLATIAREKA